MLKKINVFLMFFFPVFMILPDLAIRVVVINLRFDDIIIYLLTILNIREIFNFKKNYKPYYFYVGFLVLICIAIVSVIITNLRQHEPMSSYMVTRFFGSLPLFITLPVLTKDKNVRVSMCRGAALAIIVYIGSLFYYRNFVDASLIDVADQSDSLFKASFAPATLNINSLTVLGTLLGIYALDYYIFTKKKYLIFLTIIAFAVPFIIFSRANVVCIIMMLAFFTIFSHKSPKLKFAMFAVALMGLLVYIIMVVSGNPLFQEAFSVDLKSGKGMSGRQDLWLQGVELIKWSKGLGWGFATEPGLYKKYFHGKISHMLYLHYTIELGFHSTLLFLFCEFYLIFTKYKFYMRTGSKFSLLQAATLFGFFCSCFFDHMLYLKKTGLLVFMIITMPDVFYYETERLKERRRKILEKRRLALEIEREEEALRNKNIQNNGPTEPGPLLTEEH